MKGQAESPEVLQGHPMSTLSLDIKILFGRRKIKYELCTPNRQPKSKGVLMIDFPFTAISYVFLPPNFFFPLQKNFFFTIFFYPPNFS